MNSASSSILSFSWWRRRRARLRSRMKGPSARVFVAFWLLGLINNVLYVIILSAALDLVGPLVPKSLVLLADVLPSFFVKLIAPYFIHIVPYSVRTIVCVALSTGGMLLVAMSPHSKDASGISIKLLGVCFASLSSGGGELSFLGLTNYYGHLSLAGWSSGTGGAGLIGAGAYALATTTFGLDSRKALLSSCLLPLIMLLSFFVLLPDRDSNSVMAGAYSYQSVQNQEDDDAHEGLSPDSQPSDPILPLPEQAKRSVYDTFGENLLRARKLFLPYMVPLLLVYVAEYTINQGVSPTLLFPLPSTPFKAFRDFYPTYNAIYQVGVFISRSSTPFVRVHHLYLPSFLQVINLCLLILHALFGLLPNIWCVFLVIFWEGLLGGLVYVNTYAEIIDNVPSAEGEREFSLSAVTVSDSGGITIAAFLSMFVETSLCSYQVAHGVDYCRRT